MRKLIFLGKPHPSLFLFLSRGVVITDRKSVGHNFRSFSLLFFSSLGLILILAASVSLLYKIGNVELPGTLSAVGGNGGGHIKRD